MCGKIDMNKSENEIQIAITGNSGGQAYCGDNEAQEYAKNFYNPRYKGENSNYLCCEIREENGRVCFYYSFIVTKVGERETRDNSGYFAITLRARERYCEDLSRLYQLLCQVYEKFAVGKLIDKNKHILVSDLNNPHSKELITKLRKYLSECFSKSFTPWKKGHIKPKDETILRRYISEAGCDLFFDDFCNHGTAFLSPSFPRAEERMRDLNRQLQEQKKAWEAKENDLSKRATKNNELNTRILQLENTVRQLESDKSRLEEQNRLSDNINPKIDELVRLLRSYSPQEDSIHSHRKPENPVDAKIARIKHFVKRNKRSILIMILAVLIVIVIIVFLVKQCSSKDSDKVNLQEETQTTAEKEAIYPLNIELDDSDTLKLHDKTLSIVDEVSFVAPDNVNVKEWRMDGFDLQDSAGNRCTVMVNKSYGDTVTISFTTDRNVKYKHRFVVK